MTDGILRSVTHFSSVTQAPSPAAIVPPLLLDSYPGAAFAYSFRKLRSAYAGSAVRIRRSSDNAEADIGFSGNDFDTAAAATHIGGGTGFINAWYDQSGNGADVTQATAGLQPTYSAAGLESKPTMTYGASIELAAGTTDFGTGTQGTLFGVLIQNGASSVNRLMEMGNAGGGNGFGAWATHFDTIYMDFGNETGAGRLSVAQPSGWDDNSHVLELYRDSSDVQGITVDGVSLTTGSRTQDFSTPATPLTVGSQFGAGFQGQISEFIFWGTDLGGTNRAAARTEINTYWGAF